MHDDAFTYALRSCFGFMIIVVDTNELRRIAFILIKSVILLNARMHCVCVCIAAATAVALTIK